jgi:carbon storage regulator
MLVLSRKVGESIQIAGDIKVTVTQVRGGRVRLSIEAPASVRIARREIVLKQQDESEKGSDADPSMLSEHPV